MTEIVYKKYWKGPDLARFEVERIWRDRENFEYLSVTTVLQDAGIVDSGQYPPGASEHGTKVHDTIEAILTDQPYTITDDIRGKIAAFILFMEESQAEVVAAEARVSNRKHRCSGRIDLIARLFGRKDNAIIDYKSGGKERWHGTQTAGYALTLHEEPDDGWLTAPRYCLYLKETGKYLLVKYDDPGDIDKFRKALDTAWRQRTTMTEITKAAEEQQTKEQSGKAMTMETARIANVAQEALDFAKDVQITDDNAYSVVGEFLKGLKAVEHEIDEIFDPILRRQREALDEARQRKETQYGPVREAERLCKEKMAAYYRLKEELRRKEEARLRLEAQKVAEEEQKRQAAALEKAGKKEEAKELMQQPAEAAPVTVASTTPRIRGISMGEVWNFEITDASLLPREYLQPDEVKIRGAVQRLGAEAKIPGVRIFKAPRVAASRLG